MWLYCTGNDGLPPVVLYDYKTSRSGDNARAFLEGFHGYLHTDGYSNCNNKLSILCVRGHQSDFGRP